MFLLLLDFDIVIGTASGPPGGDVWSEAASMPPARRRYLFSFQGLQPALSSTYFNGQYVNLSTGQDIVDNCYFTSGNRHGILELFLKY